MYFNLFSLRKAANTSQKTQRGESKWKGVTSHWNVQSGMAIVAPLINIDKYISEDGTSWNLGGYTT